MAHTLEPPRGRRERRLRQFLRHERLTVAMVLSEKKHHTSRGQKKDRTTGEEYELNYTAKIRKTPPPEAAATVYYPLTDDEGGGLAAGERPLALPEPRPQVGIQQHSGIGFEFVLALDAPALRTVDDDYGILSVAEELAVTLPGSAADGRRLPWCSGRRAWSGTWILHVIWRLCERYGNSC